MERFIRSLKNDIRVVKNWFIRMDSHERILFLLLVCYISYFTLASFLRYDSFYTGRFDLGNMVQAIWNTSQGRILAASDDVGITSRLAYHADFFLAFLAPFYLLWPHPKFILFFQTVILALGAVFVYKLSTHILHRKTISLVFAASYLLNPSIQRSNLYDFHAVVLATTFLLGAFYFMKLRRYRWFLLFAFLAGSTKEEVWAIVGLFGLFIFSRAFYSLRAARKEFLPYLKKELQFGIVVTILSFATFYLFLSVIIPSFHGKEHFATAFFTDYGDNPSNIATGILSSPIKVFGVITDESRRTYLRQLLLPIGYLSVFSPLYLFFALPDLLINLLSKNANFQQIYYQYTATITPFLYIAGIYGVRLIRYFSPKISLTILSLYLLVMAVYGAYLYGPLPFSKNPNLAMFIRPRPNSVTIESFLQTIPQDAVIAANNQLGSHLSERRVIHTLPVGLDQSTYVLFLLSDSTATPSMQANRDMADRMRNDPNYILLFEDGDFLAFKKNRLSYLLY
ncbi:MAG: DUF2079 domain-containing protein [bacterium]|nr:DUF2079 domain-containing protein [bacterium]